MSEAFPGIDPELEKAVEEIFTSANLAFPEALPSESDYDEPHERIKKLQAQTEDSGSLLLQGNALVKKDDVFEVELEGSVHKGLYLQPRKLWLCVMQAETGLLSVIHDSSDTENWLTKDLQLGIYLGRTALEGKPPAVRLPGTLRENHEVMADLTAHGFQGDPHDFAYLHQKIVGLSYYGQRFY